MENFEKLIGFMLRHAGLILIVSMASPAFSQECDPNYANVCVPISSDVDCAGGNGNGPDYVTGPVYIVGTDIYELDRDGDGVACEKK